MNFAVYRIMYQLFDKGVLDEPRPNKIKENVRSQEHSDLSRKIAEDSMVLLKNKNHALPLDISAGIIHVVGNKMVKPIIAGGGSGEVHM
jgi:beta-glucosidase